MTEKKPRVPPTRAARPNREMRRHPEKMQNAPPPTRADDAAPDAQVLGGDRPQDVASVRAKNSGHGKKTADKWNQ